MATWYEAWSIEHHRQHGLTQEHTRLCLLIEAVEVFHQPNFLAHAGHQPQVIQALYCKTRHETSSKTNWRESLMRSGHLSNRVPQKSFGTARERAEDGLIEHAISLLEMLHLCKTDVN